MKKIFEYIKQYYMFPFLVLFSYMIIYERFLITIKAGNTLFIQIGLFIIGSFLAYILSKTSKKILSHISIALIGIISQGYICFTVDSLSNISALKEKYNSTAKFLVGWAKEVMSIPFLTFLALVLICLFATLFYSLNEKEHASGRFSFLLLTFSIAVYITAALLGCFSFEYILMLPLSLSLYSTRLLNKAFKNSDSKFSLILNLYVLLTVVYRVLSNYLLNKFIY